MGLLLVWHKFKEVTPPLDQTLNVYLIPLEMEGGDPYIRALMRTISASEANVPKPYAVLYGNRYVQDLSHHPDQCVRIVIGPNTDNCTTAAGRYQILTETWIEKSLRYHPQRFRFGRRNLYSFEPEFQDAVVYAWLSDREAWGTDIAELLREGKFKQVLWILSKSWTSLGYGIENNSMTRFLPAVYQRMLQEELKTTK